MRLLPLTTAALLVAAGCGHHRANQYSYAPPLMPPVYPQPQAPGPVVTPAALPAAPAGAPVVAPQALPPGAVMPPVTPTAFADPCAAVPCEGTPVVYEDGGVPVMQSPPCPPGP